MNKQEIINVLKNTVVSTDCPGWYPSVEMARLNLIAELESGRLFIDYEDHKAVNIQGACICARTAVQCAGLTDVLLVHTGIYTTTVTFYNSRNPLNN